MSRHQAVCDVFTAIADPTRRALLRQLREGEQPVTTLAEQFEVTLSAISQHLHILRQTDLVRMRKAGRERLYRLNADALKPVADWLAFYEPFWNNKLDALETYLNQTHPLQTHPSQTHPLQTQTESPKGDTNP